MKLFEFLALYDYTEGLNVFTALITFIYSLRYYGRHRALRIVPYYVGSCLLLAGVYFCRYISPPSDRFTNTLYTTGTAAFTLFELCVFYLLILHYVEGAGRRLVIKLNAVIFFIAEIYVYFRAFPRNPLYSMSMVEVVALVPPCAIYFYELFTNMNTKAIKDRPSFWVVIGIVYQSACGACMLLSMEYMGRLGDGAIALGNLFYCVLFVLIMRAYKCSPEEWAAA